MNLFQAGIRKALGQSKREEWPGLYPAPQVAGYTPGTIGFRPWMPQAMLGVKLDSSPEPHRPPACPAHTDEAAPRMNTASCLTRPKARVSSPRAAGSAQPATNQAAATAEPGTPAATCPAQPLKGHGPHQEFDQPEHQRRRLTNSQRTATPPMRRKSPRTARTTLWLLVSRQNKF